MATTRGDDFKSLGKFAGTANQVTPGVGERLNTESYRNTALTPLQQRRGKQFGVVPVSENVNQQIFNQTQFTDLIDTQGIPGWSFQVTYDKPAAVLASDGKIYFNKRDGNINTDPLSGRNKDAEYWGEFVSGGDLANLYAVETEGQEGARLVGTNYVPSLNPRPEPDPMTLQSSLTDEYARLLPMQNMEILAEVNARVKIEDFPQFTALDAKSFNIDSIDITKYDKDVPAGGAPIDRLGFLTINFTNPIPTPYIYTLEIIPDGSHVFTKLGGNTRFTIHATSLSVADATATSIKVGGIWLTNGGAIAPVPGWPANWGDEDPSSRKTWKVGLTCFTFN